LPFVTRIRAKVADFMSSDTAHYVETSKQEICHAREARFPRKRTACVETDGDSRFSYRSDGPMVRCRDTTPENGFEPSSSRCHLMPDNNTRAEP
jgi:hypothetical protein